MIKRIRYAFVYVKDQNEALRFYTECLGFEIREDVTVGDYRWLTVGLKDQPDVNFGLARLQAGDSGLTEEEVAALTKMRDAGHLGGILLQTDDIYKTYEELKAKGVEFIRPPEDQFYGMIEAVFKDNSGNWFSLEQLK